MTVDQKFCPPAPIPDALAVSTASYKRLRQLAGTPGCPVVSIGEARRPTDAQVERARLRQFAVNGEIFELLVIEDGPA